MPLRRNCLLLGLLLLASACVRPAQVPSPEEVPLETLAQEADDPARAASMRLVLQGRQELDRSRFERAAHLISQAVEIDPQNPFAYFFLGLTRLRTSRFDQSAELFRQAGDLFGDRKAWRAESWAYRGECLEKLGRREEARRAFEEATDWNSGNARARAGLERLES